jgi:LPXTG-motif cell wall-anchored protein
MIHFLLAQAYGQGAYSTGTYGGDNLSIGPITLPVTGPTALAIVSALAIGIGVGLFVWARQKRKNRLTPTSPQQ